MTMVVQNQGAPKKCLLMLGDSLVAGSNWQERFTQWQVHNCGINGLTTFALRQSLPRVQRCYPQADLIMIMIGTNDLLMGDVSFTADLAEILGSLATNYPASTRLVCNLLPMQVSDLDNEILQATNMTIRTVVTNAGASLLDLHRRFSAARDQLFLADGVHLTTAAYDLWGATLLEHIAFLGKND